MKDIAPYLTGSILRDEEYKALANVTLSGKVLDIGGAKASKYHEIVNGAFSVTCINIDPKHADVLGDIEKSFPFDDGSYDHALCMNLLEHVYEFENVISETHRVLKQGGLMIIATPMIYHIHASPDDYHRYTASSYKRMAEKFGFTVETLRPLGHGFFSLGFQIIGGGIPFKSLRRFIGKIAVSADIILSKLSKGYVRLGEKIPLGYFVVFKKM